MQLALIAFALSGLLSLAIDIGYARLTQSQMQTAADSAALEGLRQRDAVRNPANGNPIAYASDCLRRAAANRMVHWTFDDDFDYASGDQDYQFGGGPVVNMDEGVTSVHALQTVTVPEQHVYKPDLQMNQQNQVYGDMVSGRFCYTTEPVPSEGGAYEFQDIVCTEPQHATGTYSRGDFNPNLTVPGLPATVSECPAPDAAATPLPPGGTGNLTGVDDSAFLVRLRRSNDFQDLSGQMEEGVGSSGSSLPLMFGKGTTIHGDDPNSDYSVRRDGLTVRATAIAQTRPVLHLGTPQSGQTALAAFDLSDVCASTPTGAALTIPVTIDLATGVMRRTNAPGATPMCPPNAVVGRLIVNPTASVPAVTSTLIRTLGTVPPTANVPTACQNVPVTIPTRHAAVYSLMANGQTRIIGYAGASFARVATCPGAGRGRVVPPYTATITRTVSTVEPSNATAIFAEGLLAGVPPGIVPELLRKNLAAAGQLNYGPVLAPVLAR